MLNVTPDSIFQVATGFMASKQLFVANEIGLFEQLAKGPADLEELSRRIGVPRRTTRIHSRSNSPNSAATCPAAI